MKLKLLKEVEYEVEYLYVDVGPRYWEDATVNGADEEENSTKIPFKNGDRWQFTIDIVNGTIENWPHGTTARAFYKVCDDGIYTLQDIHRNTIMVMDDYVPTIIGDGDYIKLEIDETGKIVDFYPTLEDFKEYNMREFE